MARQEATLVTSTSSAIHSSNGQWPRRPINGSSIGSERTMMLHLPAIAGRLAALVSLAAPSVAFDTYPKNSGIDALNYAFHIELTDTTDAIVGEMTLDVRFLAPNVRSVRLDLAKRDAAHGGQGM